MSRITSGLLALALILVVSAPAFAEEEPAPVACIYGFSKDICGGRLNVNHLTSTSCPSPDPTPVCNTISSSDSVLKGRIRTSGGTCGHTNLPCDEFEQYLKVNNFYADFGWQLNNTSSNPCRLKGCWKGAFTFTYEDLTGIRVVARGDGAGTLGTGSHRKVDCGDGLPCGPDCESCLDVEYLEDLGLWRIGLEGMIQGRALAGEQRGAQLCLMIQGDLFARGDENGIADPADGFEFCGTIDGVAVGTCP